MGAWKWLRRLGYVTAAVVLLGLGMVGVGWRAFGQAPTGARLQRIQASPAYRGGQFDNSLPTYQASLGRVLRRWFVGAPHGEPSKPLPVLKRRSQEFEKAPTSGLRITWLGHSSTLVEIDSVRVLTDPVFSARCSPWSFYGPERFHEVPVGADDLPDVDVVVLSHDHFDHLDQETIIALSDTTPVFLAPLGVGAHLEYWGVAPEKIVELDWWQQTQVKGLTITATPARHFSGRTYLDKNPTLWASWVFTGPAHRVYFSGDTALFPEFAEIGQRFGPFDATLLEVGAYDADWPDAHLGPEQAVIAHRMLRGDLLFPVHWGTFNLAMHSWVEPVERVVLAAATQGVRLVVPRPGESVEPSDAPDVVQWWPDVPWRRAEQAPVYSTGVEPLQALAIGH